MIQIEFKISKDGTVKYTVNGVEGPACHDISQAFLTMGEVVSDEPTDDFYKSSDQGVSAGY